MNIFQSHNCIIAHYIVLCTNSPASSSANEMMNLWWWFIRPGKEQVLVSPIHTFFSFQLPDFLSSSRAINRLNRNKSFICHCSQTYFKIKRQIDLKMTLVNCNFYSFDGELIVHEKWLGLVVAKRRESWSLPTHKVSKNIKTIEVGWFASSVHVTSSYGFPNMVSIGKYRQNVIYI